MTAHVYNACGSIEWKRVEQNHSTGETTINAIEEMTYTQIQFKF